MIKLKKSAFKVLTPDLNYRESPGSAGSRAEYYKMKDSVKSGKLKRIKCPAAHNEAVPHRFTHSTQK